MIREFGRHLKELQNQGTVIDRVVFYFGGHGGEDSGAGTHLYGYNGNVHPTETSNESLVVYVKEILEELASPLGEYPVLLILDCCRVGVPTTSSVASPIRFCNYDVARATAPGTTAFNFLFSLQGFFQLQFQASTQAEVTVNTWFSQIRDSIGASLNNRQVPHLGYHFDDRDLKLALPWINPVAQGSEDEATSQENESNGTGDTFLASEITLKLTRKDHSVAFNHTCRGIPNMIMALVENKKDLYNIATLDLDQAENSADEQGLKPLDWIIANLADAGVNISDIDIMQVSNNASPASERLELFLKSENVKFIKSEPNIKKEHGNDGKDFWWVNHKQTYTQETQGGFIWSPKTNRNGSKNQYYENLTLCKPGDIIFSYAHKEIRQIGTIQRAAVSTPKTVEFGAARDNWNTEGWKGDVKWYKLPKPLIPIHHWAHIQPMLPEKYGPLHKSTGKGVQNYLAGIGHELGEFLLSIASNKCGGGEIIDAISGNHKRPAPIASKSSPRKKLKTEKDEKEEKKMKNEKVKEEIKIKTENGEQKHPKGRVVWVSAGESAISHVVRTVENDIQWLILLELVDVGD